VSEHLADQGKPTQTAYPWRATARTVVAYIIGGALLAPAIYTAIFQEEPAAATGWAAVALAVAGAITRIMAIPKVNALLTRIGLGAGPKSK